MTRSTEVLAPPFIPYAKPKQFLFKLLSNKHAQSIHPWSREAVECCVKGCDFASDEIGPNHRYFPTGIANQRDCKSQSFPFFSIPATCCPNLGGMFKSDKTWYLWACNNTAWRAPAALAPERTPNLMGDEPSELYHE